MVGPKGAAIRAELLALKKRGVIKAEDVYEWVEKHPKSALYARLEWDNNVAGRLHRIAQITAYITLYITDKSGKPETVSLSIDRMRPGGGHRIEAEVKATPELRAILEEDLLVDLERMADRHADLDRFARVWAEVRKVRATLTSERTAKPVIRRRRKSDHEDRPTA